MIRVLPWPFSPRNSRSCPEINARLMSGITVLSNPMTPGNNSSPAASIRRKLSRISCLIDFGCQPLSRSSRSVVGRRLGWFMTVLQGFQGYQMLTFNSVEGLCHYRPAHRLASGSPLVSRRRVRDFSIIDATFVRQASRLCGDGTAYDRQARRTFRRTPFPIVPASRRFDIRMWPIILVSVYCLLVALASLFGGSLPSKMRLTHTEMQTIMSFVGGLVLGVGLLHMVPHSVAETNSIDTTVGAALIGLLTMFLLIRIFQVHQHGPVDQMTTLPSAGAQALWFTNTIHAKAHQHECGHRHEHGDEHRQHDAPEPCTHAPEYPVDGQLCATHRHEYSWIGLGAGLALHTMIDGMALAASVSASARHGGADWKLLGVGTFLAVLLHKPLDAMSITSVMVAGGWSARAQWLVNLGFASMCAAGRRGLLPGHPAVRRPAADAGRRGVGFRRRRVPVHLVGGHPARSPVPRARPSQTDRGPAVRHAASRVDRFPRTGSPARLRNRLSRTRRTTTAARIIRLSCFGERWALAHRFPSFGERWSLAHRFPSFGKRWALAHRFPSFGERWGVSPPVPLLRRAVGR
jgi:zinc transporter ZupT